MIAHEQLTCNLLNHKETDNVLYAFISNGEVKYIGKTLQPLSKRMYSYEKPGKSQSTNIRNKNNILHLLRNDEVIDIFILPDNGLLHYGGFHLNLAAGLEDALIRSISPEWNGKLLNKRIEKETSTKEDLKNYPLKSSFDVKIGNTYYNQGFFNVGVKHQSLFGADGDNIEINLTDGSTIFGYINRNVNTNNTPRIMGGKDLRDWIQSKFSINDTLKVEVLSPISIKIG